MSVKVKICGVTRAEDARAAVAVGAAAIGLNFAPESPRCLTLEKAATIVEQVRGAKVLLGAVFVNKDTAELLHWVRTLKLDIVQLHGEETQATARILKNELPPGIHIWKAFRVSTAEDLAQLWTAGCDAWLLDAKAPGMRGGSGKSFDWKILAALKRQFPIVLAGGLNPGNVAAAVSLVRPDWVDVASGVESSPGIKDAAMMKQFVDQAAH